MKIKEKNIRKILEMTGISESSKAIFNALLSSMSLPEDAKKEILDFLMTEENMGILIDGYVKIYDETFTAKEIKDIINFYATKTGKKMISSVSIIADKSNKLGQEWGDKMFKSISDKITSKIDKHYTSDLPKIEPKEAKEDLKDTDNLIKNRIEFAVNYAKSKGWGSDITKYTTGQILEIRSQDGWIKAGK